MFGKAYVKMPHQANSCGNTLKNHAGSAISTSPKEKYLRDVLIVLSLSLPNFQYPEAYSIFISLIKSLSHGV